MPSLNETHERVGESSGLRELEYVVILDPTPRQYKKPSLQEVEWRQLGDFGWV